jgi:serine/threonine-protein kinase
MATCPTCKTHYADDVKTCAADGEPLLPDEAFAAADTDLAAGQVVGEYRVEGKLGEGGFGAVYRAVHPLIGKTAAIKVLHKQYSSNPQMVSRFVAEARAVNQIRNRNIIDIFSFGSLDDGRQYYVMELLDGVTMDGYLKQRGRVPPEEAIPMLRGVARALDAAHAAGIAHRDLKPENVFLLLEDDGPPIPKLLDFGIAKLLGESTAGHKTRTGTPMGTPFYMSPEQCRGRNVDHRTDIYSFGILLFETLTGHVPFDGEDVMEILVKNTTAPAPRPSDVCHELPPELDAAVLAFLEKDPAMRPSSVGVGLDALASAAAGAGLDVKVSARRTPGAEAQPIAERATVRVRTGGAVTPAEVVGQTMMVDEAGRTMLAAEVGPKPPQRTMLVGVVGALVVVGAIAAGLAMRRSDSAGVAPPPTGAPPEAATATATASAIAVPSIAPAPPASAGDRPAVVPSTDLPSGEVELTINTEPKVVDVYDGATKIGSSAAPVKLKRRDGKVKLTLKAPGYAPEDVEVAATANAVVAAKLKKVASGRRGDLEF